VAFVCDDELFIKPTEAGRAYIKNVEEKPAYPGSKLYFWISGELWDDRDWLCKLITVTAAALPTPKLKINKLKKS
jgi:TfoX/Sxy family transcriptional regulator of competence genes